MYFFNLSTYTFKVLKKKDYQLNVREFEPFGKDMSVIFKIKKWSNKYDYKSAV